MAMVAPGVRLSQEANDPDSPEGPNTELKCNSLDSTLRQQAPASHSAAGASTIRLRVFLSVLRPRPRGSGRACDCLLQSPLDAARADVQWNQISASMRSQHQKELERCRG